MAILIDPVPVEPGDRGSSRQLSLPRLLWTGLFCLSLGVLELYFRVEPPGIALFLALTAIAAISSVAAHEIGHAIGGMAAGFRIIMIAIWPVRLWREGDSWRFGWLRRKALAGFVVPCPVGAHNLVTRMFVGVAAGPCASALAGIVAGVLAAHASHGWPRWLAHELNLIAIFSILIAATDLLPARYRNVTGDGMRLRMLLRGGAEAERYCAVSLLGASSAGGVLPREWDPSLVRLAAGPADGSPDAHAGRAQAYNWAMDVGEIEEAELALAEALAQEWPDEERAIWYLEAACFQARIRGDLPAARRWLQQAPASS